MDLPLTLPIANIRDLGCPEEGGFGFGGVLIQSKSARWTLMDKALSEALLEPMRHLFRSGRESGGRAFDEPVLWSD